MLRYVPYLRPYWRNVARQEIFTLAAAAGAPSIQLRHIHSHFPLLVSQSTNTSANNSIRPTISSNKKALLLSEDGLGMDKLNVVRTNYLDYYQMPLDSPVLVAHKVSVEVADRLIFRDISFSLKPGSCLLLQGQNGAGKTTLLHSIAGFVPILTGNYIWDGTVCSHGRYGGAEWLLQNGYIFYVSAQRLGLEEEMNCEENLQFVINLYGANTKPSDILKLVHLHEISLSPAKFLSTGQAKRLALARLASVPAPIWLLDEPTIALDKQAIFILEEMIRDHRRRGGIVIIASHTNMRLENAVSLRLDELAAY